MAKKAAAAAETTSEDDGAPTGGVPLFPKQGSDWSYIDVSRVDPPEEVGFLGRMDLHATEETIKGRFGGGKYTVRARNEKHQVMTNRTIDIAGDPIFLSDSARDAWLRGRGREKEIPPRTGQPVAAAPAAQSFGVAEMVALFQGMQQMQMQQHTAAMAAQAEERRAREAEIQRREDRQREEDRRREDQRRAEENQREERRLAEEERARARDREFMTTMINVVTAKPGGEAGQMAAFTNGLTLALKMAGTGGGGRDDDDDGEEDPIAETVRGVVKGLGDAVSSRIGAPAAAPPAVPALPPVAPGQPEPVTFTGPLAAQVGEFVRKAQAAGKNPEALLAGGVDVMMKSLAKPSNGAAGVAAAAAAVKAGEKAPPPAS